MANTSAQGPLAHYYEFMDTNCDPRTNDWFLVHGWFPFHLVSILALYVYFCKSLGPKMMKDRKPFDLRQVLIVYNAVNVTLSVWLVYEAMAAGWWLKYNYQCQPVDYSNTAEALRMPKVVWLYYMCKLLELLETVFFVLRKKDNQVSYLHLYHHLIMPIGSWGVLKFGVAAGHTTLGIPINAFVHAVMYTYYLLAAMGPQYQKYLWWKKYLTTLQLVQFTIVVLHQCQVFFIECDFPKLMAILMAGNSVYLFILFGAFYVRNYISKAKAA